jgi:sigma-B regulation protein RsbU (phosphoserine phosphatase)
MVGALFSLSAVLFGWQEACVTVIDRPRPFGEADRLAEVRRFEVLDTPPDGAFDHITALAARLLRVPISVVSIVDADRIWFKSRHGLPEVSEIGRDSGLCASAILDYEPWIVTDATVDPRTLTNPLVAGSFGLRFYAGVPLTTSNGHNLGTLCVIDREPRQITPQEVETLRDLARLVMDQLELRLHAREIVEAESELRREAEKLADVLQASLLPPRPPRVPGMEVASRFIAGERGMQVGGDFYDVFRRGVNDWGIVLGDVCGKGAQTAALAASARWTVRASAGHQTSPAAVLADLNTAVLADGNADTHYLTAVFAQLELDTCGAWLTFATGGHPLPMLVRRSGVVEPRGDSSLPIGMFDDIEPPEHRVGLGPGDSLLFYTDGVVEARNADGEFFGDDRLLDVLTRCTGGPAQDIVDRVLDAVHAFSGGPSTDDVAVVVVRVPDDAGSAPLQRVVTATGVPEQELRLPGYPHG